MCYERSIVHQCRMHDFLLTKHMHNTNDIPRSLKVDLDICIIIKIKNICIPLMYDIHCCDQPRCGLDIHACSHSFDIYIWRRCVTSRGDRFGMLHFPTWCMLQLEIMALPSTIIDRRLALLLATKSGSSNQPAAPAST